MSTTLYVADRDAGSPIVHIAASNMTGHFFTRLTRICDPTVSGYATRSRLMAEAVNLPAEITLHRGERLCLACMDTSVPASVEWQPTLEMAA